MRIITKKAFSLLEMTVVIIVITVLLTSAVPSFYRMYLEKASTKTAMDIQNIENAARSYFNQNSSWPSSITPIAGQNPATDLESNAFLPQGWNATNPFGNQYSGVPNASGTLFIVSTQVPSGAPNIIASQLPLSTVSGQTVISMVSPPGSSPAVKIFSGLVYDGQTIPLPSGYTDAECHWFVSPYNAVMYDSSGKGGCENLETMSTYLTGTNGRTAVANNTGDCRGSWSFYLNYTGICTNT